LKGRKALRAFLPLFSVEGTKFSLFISKEGMYLKVHTLFLICDLDHKVREIYTSEFFDCNHIYVFDLGAS
jgi:hypothetical protein